MDDKDKEQRLKDFYAQKLDDERQGYADFYFKDDARELKKVIYNVFGKERSWITDWDYYYVLATDIFVNEVLPNYDSSKGSFKSWLNNCMARKLKTGQTATNRQKNTPYLQGKNGVIRDEKDNPVKASVVSFDAPIEDEYDLKDVVSSDFDLNDEIFGNEFSELLDLLLDSLSDIQREIAEIIMSDDKIPACEIKSRLGLSDREYKDAIECITHNKYMGVLRSKKSRRKENRKVQEVNEMELENNGVSYIDDDMIMDLDTTDNHRVDTRTIKTLLDEKDEGELDCTYVSQRKALVWSEEQINKYYSRILNNQHISELVVCETIEEGKKVSYLVNGLQRISYADEFRNNRLPCKAKGAEFKRVKYKKYEYDGNGNKILDENGRAVYTIDIFDITDKYYDDLPEYLQKRFDNFNYSVVRYFNCTYDMIDYHIRNYNNNEGMTKSDYGITNVSNKTATNIKTISENHKFFINNVKCTNKSIKKGTLEGIVANTVITTFFIDDWKKDIIDSLKFVDKNATDEQFKRLSEILDRLYLVADKSVKDLFNVTNGHIWIAAFDKFADLGIEDVKFVEFMKEFKEVLHSKQINGRSYDDVNNRNTKDKKTVKNKLEVIVDLMMDYLHIEETEEVSDEEFIADMTEMDVEEVSELMDLCNETLDDLLTGTIVDGNKLLDEENRQSLLALVMYGLNAIKQTTLESWFKEYIVENPNYIRNQKQNYLHMRNDLNKFCAIG